MAIPLGDMWCRNVVVATGDLDLPRFPRIAAELPAGLMQLHSSRYRNPDQLPAGAVLVVGAGPSGQQIADELARAGREVHIAVGRHQMLPRRYRGSDSYWWLDRLGMLSRTVDSLAHPDDRFAPNAVLTGGTIDLDLHRLVRAGVYPHGRLCGFDGTSFTFGTDLAETVINAEVNAVRFRRAVDDYVHRTGTEHPRVAASHRPTWLHRKSAASNCRRRNSSALCGRPGSPPTGAGCRPVRWTPPGNPASIGVSARCPGCISLA